MDQGSTMKRSAVHNFAPTVTKFCVMWEGQALPHDTKFGNSRCEIVGRRVIFIWSLIHGLRWSGLIKAEPGCRSLDFDDADYICYLNELSPFDIGATVTDWNGVTDLYTFCTESEYPKSAGPRLNIKTVLSTYGDFHVKDKTAVRTSYL